MDLGLKNTVVIVAGAAGGIGQAVLPVLAEEEATVFATDKVASPGIHGFDPAVPDAADAVVQACLEQHGRLDAMIYCVGISRPALVSETSDALWAEVIDVNLSTLFRLCRAAQQPLAKAQWPCCSDRILRRQTRYAFLRQCLLHSLQSRAYRPDPRAGPGMGSAGSTDQRSCTGPCRQPDAARTA